MQSVVIVVEDRKDRERIINNFNLLCTQQQTRNGCLEDVLMFEVIETSNTPIGEHIHHTPTVIDTEAADFPEVTWQLFKVEIEIEYP
jgi:hypothetical protein